MAADEWDVNRWRDQQDRQWHDELAARRRSEMRVNPPELCGVRIRIRPLEPGDEAQLYQWVVDTRECWLWREEPGLVSFDGFREQLRRARAANEPHFIIEGLQSGRMIGWVYADQFSAAHRRCHMHVYVVPEARIYGAGAEAAIYFLDLLFGWLGMRKVIAEALLAHRRAWKMAEFWGFQMEGILREEQWLDSHAHDVVRLAIQRSVWRQRIIAAVSASDASASSAAPHLRRVLQTNGMFFPDRDKPQKV